MIVVRMLRNALKMTVLVISLAFLGLRLIPLWSVSKDAPSPGLVPAREDDILRTSQEDLVRQLARLREQLANGGTLAMPDAAPLLEGKPVPGLEALTPAPPIKRSLPQIRGVGGHAPIARRKVVRVSE